MAIASAAEHHRGMEQADIRDARGRTGAALGAASAALLFASIRWAHHWDPGTVSIVVGWASSTIAAFVVSVRSLRTTSASRRLATAGVLLTLVSPLTVALFGVLYAVGVDASTACCGG